MSYTISYAISYTTYHAHTIYVQNPQLMTCCFVRLLVDEDAEGKMSTFISSSPPGFALIHNGHCLLMLSMELCTTKCWILRPNG